MKKYLLFPVAILLLGSGCANQPIFQNKVPQENSNPTIGVSSEKSIDSPLSALLDYIEIGDPNGEYARLTNIRIKSDAEAGFNHSSFTVIYIEEGIADDEIRKLEYELKLQRKKNGSWKVTDKRLVKKECYEGRGCK